MLQSKNFWVVTFNGSPDLWSVKPPLMIWLQMLSYKIFGVTKFALRFPAALAALTSTMLIYFSIIKYFGRPKAAFLAILVLISSEGFIGYHVGRTGDYDSLLILFLLLQLFSFYQYLKTEKSKYLWQFALFIFLGVMTKSIAGLFFLPGIFLFVVIKNKWKIIFRPRVFMAAGLAIVGIGAYYLYREYLSEGYLQAVWNNELGGRYQVAQEDNSGPWWYYIYQLTFYQYAYWIWWLPIVGVIIIKAKKNINRELLIYMLLIATAFVILISLAATKLRWYIAPIFPLLAVYLGIGLDLMGERIRLWLDKKRRNMNWVLRVVPLIIFLLPALLVIDRIHVYPKKQERHGKLSIEGFLPHIDSFDEYKILVDGYDGRLDFYAALLNYRGKEVTKVDTQTTLLPGENIVFSDSLYYAHLEEKYDFELLVKERNYGLVKIMTSK